MEKYSTVTHVYAELMGILLTLTVLTSNPFQISRLNLSNL